MSNCKWKVVTLIRDPIARNVSTLFEVANLFYGYETDFSSKSFDIMFSDFRNLFSRSYQNEKYGQRHDTPLTWLDDEIKEIFDIDVYATEFPKHRGYTIYHGANIDLLIIRLEDLNKCVQNAFQEFLGIEDFILINKNISNKKDYGRI